MKRAVLCIILIGLVVWTVGAKGNPNCTDIAIYGKSEKICDDIAAENFQYVNISGNAGSIVIRQSSDECFAFYNEDLNNAHTYAVRCTESGDTLDIAITMERTTEDNDILGSVVIDIPQKEFEKIAVAGDFKQVSLYTIGSDVLIHANDLVVNLDLEAERLEHNITLAGSKSDAFRSVSVYLDKLPENVTMELNPTQDGTINDPQNMLEKNAPASGTGKPVIIISHTREINIYAKE